MERKTILVESIGAPKRIVQQIETKPETTAICPLCRTQLKNGDPAVLVDLVKQFRIARKEENVPEQVVRISICETCSQPVINQRREALDGLIKLLAELVVENMMKETGGKQK